jgi:hypothetical protein
MATGLNSAKALTAFRARRPENHLEISIAADLNCRTKLMRGGAICNFSGKDCQDKNVSHAKFFQVKINAACLYFVDRTPKN